MAPPNRREGTAVTRRTVGIAAADAICAARLGEHARGENHDEAVALLSTVDKAAAAHLRALLGMKTLAGYSHSRPL